MDPRIFKANNDTFHYQVIFSRRRTIGISISPDKGIIIRAPYRTSSVTIEEIIRYRVSWLKKHQERFSRIRESSETVSYVNGSTHLYLGTMYKMNIIESDSNSFKFTASGFEAGLKRGCGDEQIKKMLYKLYKQEAVKYFTMALNEILYRLPELNIKAVTLAVRTMKRRWGSCSVKGRITLNTELIKMDEKCIAYVIIHELCHLRHHNHGKEFYSLLSLMFPEWKHYRRRLKDHYL